MGQESASRECVTETVLQGYCRDLPLEVVTKIVEINRR